MAGQTHTARSSAKENTEKTNGPHIISIFSNNILYCSNMLHVLVFSDSHHQAQNEKYITENKCFIYT
jgi:hypothetical protein